MAPTLIFVLRHGIFELTHNFPSAWNPLLYNFQFPNLAVLSGGKRQIQIECAPSHGAKKNALLYRDVEGWSWELPPISCTEKNKRGSVLLSRDLILTRAIQSLLINPELDTQSTKHPRSKTSFLQHSSPRNLATWHVRCQKSLHPELDITQFTHHLQPPSSKGSLTSYDTITVTQDIIVSFISFPNTASSTIHPVRASFLYWIHTTLITGVSPRNVELVRSLVL